MYRLSSAIPELPLERSSIARLIPHAGPMCLLDRATFWDATVIRCEAASHLHPGHPMRRDGVLRAVAGIEYAAQAIALHGALLRQDAAPRAGHLVSVRDVRCRVAALDGASGRIEIEAQRLMGDNINAVYAFTLRAAGDELLRGRATVALGQL